MKIFNNLRRFLHYFKLESELEDFDLIYEEIKKGIIFKGTNLWVLMFAIIVASVGLNMNSTAVIIGAMLISPLMGPINGIGYSIATYNQDLFRQSIKNFSFAVLASLFASTAYFALSPISTAHSELLARTSPTIYDVLIALFGGLAGILAMSSKMKGNVIPGVAIATALMPPLCTAGYGLATFQFQYFFGAIYLFAINSIFIALAAVWVSQLLKFPIRGQIEAAKKKRINQAITVVITIVLLPSIYFGYKLIEQEKFSQKAKSYVSNISLFEGNYLLKYNIDPQKRNINLIYAGNQLTDEHKKSILQKSKDFDISESQITIEQGFSFGLPEENSSEVLRLREELLNLQTSLRQRENQIDSLKGRKEFSKIILDEVKALYPQVNSLILADTYAYNDSLNQPEDGQLVIIKQQENISANDRERMSQWLQRRLNNNQLNVKFE
jgi:uncharacterized hydrophobic protein (TIGR00271 family)